MLTPPDLQTRPEEDAAAKRPARRPAGVRSRFAVTRRRLVGLMLLVSLAVHLVLLALVLIPTLAKPPQATSPPSIDIMTDPEAAADVATDRPPDRQAPTLGEPQPDQPATEAPPQPSPAPVPPPPAAPASPESPPPTPAPPAPAPPVPTPPVPTAEAPPQPAAPPVPDVAVPAPPPAPEVPVVEAPVLPAAPQPPPVPPAPRAPAAPPAVNLNLPPPPPPPPLNLEPPPPLPPPPAPPPPAPPRRTAQAFPSPILPSWNANPFAAAPQRQPRGTGGIDLSLGPVARASRGDPPRGRQDTDAAIRVVGANVGPDWIQSMQEWWVRHRYYPQQAVANNEDGMVQVALRMDRTGKVLSVRIEGSSGSQWLDAGSLSIFRNAQLPPFPSGTREDAAEVHLTLNYLLIRRR